MTKKALVWIACVAVALAIFMAIWLWVGFPPPYDHSLRVQYLAQYVLVAQVIIVGVSVALVSVIIPLMLPESRDTFEQYKESRQAYSRAKTAVLYLPDRVAAARTKGEAFRLVEEAHRELHFAEMFERVIIEKDYLVWFDNPELWILYNYWQIVAVAEALRPFANDLGAPGSNKTLADRVHAAVDAVHERFGRRGEKCKQEKWQFANDKQGGEECLSRFDEEDKLQKKITTVLEAIPT